MTDHTKLIGTTFNHNPGRDAVHIALAPMIAIREMYPNEHLEDGIVDPFLKKSVQPGEWYFLFLYPGTVTSLRHVWSHPNFAEEK